MQWGSNEDDSVEFESWGNADFGDHHDDVDDHWSLLKGKLAPNENVLWTERAGLPSAPTLAVFPAFFTAVLCGLSGYALMVVFGLYGLREVRPVARTVLTCLPPAILGLVILFGLMGRWDEFRRTRDRLSRTLYVLTNCRALVGMHRSGTEPNRLCSVTPDLFDDTLCYENPDGSGDVLFVKRGAVLSLEIGFIGVSEARIVEELVRETLLGKFSNPDTFSWGVT
jgi:hypothetical protein